MITKLLKAIISNNIDYSNVIEVRIREGLPIAIGDGIKLETIQNNGNKVIATKTMIEEFISKVTDNSFYAYESSFCKGFINYHGSKIAICGEGVYKEDELYSFKNITSINVRIPREVIGISNDIRAKIIDNNIHSTLIIGKTATGKTTILRDIAKHIILSNVLVIDERRELSITANSLGDYTDVLSMISKEQCIELAIRGLNPDVIITDEIYNIDEITALQRAKRAGIEIIASYHGDSLQSYIDSELYCSGLFDRYVILSNERGQGAVKEYYNKELEKI